jgi:ferredoxin
MANSNGRHESNVPGAWFCTDSEDESGEGCISCSLCYSGAPEFFEADDEGYAFVKKQPTTEEEIQLCQDQLEGCPIESIGNG